MFLRLLVCIVPVFLLLTGCTSHEVKPAPEPEPESVTVVPPPVVKPELPKPKPKKVEEALPLPPVVILVAAEPKTLHLSLIEEASGFRQKAKQK